MAYATKRRIRRLLKHFLAFLSKPLDPLWTPSPHSVALLFRVDDQLRHHHHHHQSCLLFCASSQLSPSWLRLSPFRRHSWSHIGGKMRTRPNSPWARTAIWV